MRTHAQLYLAGTILLLALVACDGGGEPDAGRLPAGLSTRTPAPASTAPVAPPPGRPAGPQGTSTAGVPTDVAPDALATHLAGLGGGEDPRIVMQGLEVVAPRCEQKREEFGELLERGWRILNEQRGLAVPVSAILARIAAELPDGSERFDCESLIAGVIVSLTQ